jgi:LEA14-like dessication related protein
MSPVTRILAAMLVAPLVAGCASLTKPWAAPEVSLVGLQAKELGLARQVFVANLKVRNPNDRTLPIKAMTYRLSLEGNEFAEGAGQLDRQIPPLGEARVDVDVVGNLLGIAQQLPALVLKDRPLDWTITGTVTIADGLLKLPYWYSGKVDPNDLLAQTGRLGR